MPKRSASFDSMLKISHWNWTKISIGDIQIHITRPSWWTKTLSGRRTKYSGRSSSRRRRRWGCRMRYGWSGRSCWGYVRVAGLLRRWRRMKELKSQGIWVPRTNIRWQQELAQSCIKSRSVQADHWLARKAYRWINSKPIKAHNWSPASTTQPQTDNFWPTWPMHLPNPHQLSSRAIQAETFENSEI